MSRKKPINLSVPESLLEQFNAICDRHRQRAKGDILSAAILMFLEADPTQQGSALERIVLSDVRAGVDTLNQRALQRTGDYPRVQGASGDKRTRLAFGDGRNGTARAARSTSSVQPATAVSTNRSVNAHRQAASGAAQR